MEVQNTYVDGASELLKAVPSPDTLQSGWYKGLKNLVRSRGCDPRRLLEQHDIDALSFEDSSYHLRCSTAVRLMQSCSVLLKDPLFGLHLGEQQDPDVFGCAMALARSAPTVRAALECLVEYVPAFSSPEAGLELVEGRGVAELRWWTTVPMSDRDAQVHYHGLLLTMKTLKTLGRVHFRPRYATLSCGVGRDELRALQQRFGCPVTSKAAANAVAFSPEILDSPLPTANKLLFTLLRSGLSGVRDAARAGFVEQIGAYVRQALPKGSCCVDECATHLGTSVRTLQKRLTRMNMPFSDIVQSERMKLAKQSLLWTDRTLDEIAFQLGYAQQTSFGRAFKRIVGMTPRSFRAEGRCKADSE